VSQTVQIDQGMAFWGLCDDFFSRKKYPFPKNFKGHYKKIEKLEKYLAGKR
jgi:hypothetical protein